MGYGFQTFDPYLTFSESERGFTEKVFLRSDGTATEAAWYGEQHDGHGYLTSLWRTGRDAYATVAKKIGKEPKIEDFKEIAAAIKELEKDLAPMVQSLIEDGRLVLHEDRDSPPVTSLADTLEDAPDGWMLEVFMRVVRPGVISGQIPAHELPDFEGLLAASAVMFLDDYIIAENIDAADLDVFHDLVQTNMASAELYRETVNAAKEAVSAMGRRSADHSHRHNREMKAGALAEWEANRANISSMAAFARARHKDFGVTERTLYGWIRDHRKPKP